MIWVGKAGRFGLVLLALALRTAAPAVSQAGKIGDPAVAAQRLYAAWKARDRSAAAAVAEPKAIDKLFGARFMEMRFTGCRHGNDGFSCVWHNPSLGLDMSMEVAGGASAGYHVMWVTFSSEE